MQPLDPATEKRRGWLMLTARNDATSLGFTMSCDAGGWQSITRDLERAIGDLVEAREIDTAARGVLPLARHLERRAPSSTAHAEALERAVASLKELHVYDSVAAVVGHDDADKVTLLFFVLATLVERGTSALLDSIHAQQSRLTAFAADIASVAAQLEAVSGYTRRP